MNLNYSTIMLAIALALALIDQLFLAALFAIGAIVIAVKVIIWGTGKAAKAVGEGLTANITGEVSKADTGHPDSAVLKEGIEGAASLAGQQLFAGKKEGKPYKGDHQQFKFQGFKGVSGAAEKIIGLFKKTFK